MKYLLSLVLIVGLVGCGDGASSPDGNAGQTNPQPQSHDQPNPDSDDPPNPETDAKHNTEIDDKPDDKKSNPAASTVAGTGILIGAWTKVITGPSVLAPTYTFEEGGEGSITGPGAPPQKFTWKTNGTDKLELSIDGRQVSVSYAVASNTLRLSPPNDGPQMEFTRGAPSKHPAELVHTWISDRLLSNGVRQTMVLGKAGDLVLIQKKHLGKAAKGKWEVDGNRIKLMFVDPVSGNDRQQEFSFVIGGSEIASEDGKTTDKKANLILKGVADNKTSFVYERPLPAATKTDEAIAAPSEESPTGPDPSLRPEQVEDILAYEIGRWETRGKGTPTGGEPHDIENTVEIRWREKGKSLEYEFSLIQDGKKVTYWGHKKYDHSQSIFIVHLKWGDNPETISHEVYDPHMKTYQGQSASASPRSGTTSINLMQRVGNDKLLKTLKVFEDGQLVYVQDVVSLRQSANTEPGNAANHSEADPKQPNATAGKLIAAPLVEKEIRRALKKPEGELTKSDLDKVTKLNFAVAGIEITDQILKEVAKCTQLTSLNFNGGQITAEGLKEVAKLQKLKTLGLSDTGVTDAGLKEVAKCTQITFLNLLHTKITDAGLKEVAKLKQLNDLTLAYNKITGAGLKELANLTQLRHLWLDGTKVTKADVAELKKSLPDCRFTGP